MKRRICLIVLGFVLVVSGVYAEEAKVMPKQVGRFYVAPTFAFAPGEFDKDGEYEAYDSGEGSVRAFNLGFALEYGINDWISGALQWAPGVTVWSDVDQSIPIGTETSDSSVNANGVADLFAGAKIQLVGEKAPIKTSLFRFCIAPGVKIPLPGPDYSDQARNAANGDPVTAANQDKHVLGVGFRTYFDYLINERFTVNLYAEFLGYPLKGEMKDAGYGEYAIATAIDAARGYNLDFSYGDVTYNYDLTFEIEPAYSFPLAQGITFTAGLPLNYKTSPGKEYDIHYDIQSIDPTHPLYQPARGTAAAVDTFKGTTGTTGVFSVKPQLTVFFTNFKLPTEFKLTYSAPLSGLRERATHSLTLQARLYFRLGRS
jgi:hypothetical protein